MRHNKRREKSKNFDDRVAYVMCSRKRKYKSSEASYYANKFHQRKYACPVCGHWHLTKDVEGE